MRNWVTALEINNVENNSPTDLAQDDHTNLRKIPDTTYTVALVELN